MKKLVEYTVYDLVYTDLNGSKEIDFAGYITFSEALKACVKFNAEIWKYDPDVPGYTVKPRIEFEEIEDEVIEIWNKKEWEDLYGEP